MNNKFNLDKSKFNILFFEYYTSLNTSEESILSEAVAMVNSILYELNELNNNEYRTYYLSSSKFSTLPNKYDNVDSIILNKDLNNILNKDLNNILNKDLNNILNNDLNKNLYQWLDDNLDLFDGVFLIAAEENMNLYNLTKLIEKKNIKLFCSNSKGVFISSDKYSTYETLKNTVKQPKTIKFSFNLLHNLYNEIRDNDIKKDNKQINFKKFKYFKEFKEFKSFENFESFESFEDFVFLFINEFKVSFNSKLIIKPVNGVDCEDITILKSEKDIKDFSKDFILTENLFEEFLVQEFIDGEVVSVSLIAIQNEDKTITYPLSLNKQYIDLEGTDKYLGGEIPFNHHLKKEAFKTAISAVDTIGGLNGFVGVDLILTENEVYFIEVNSRFTTPYVALQKIAKGFKFNIIKTIIDLSFNPIENICFKDLFDMSDIVKFKKEDNELIIKY